MLKKKFSIFNIAVSTLSFAIMFLSARIIIVRDLATNRTGSLINNIILIQILLMLAFFLHGVKNYNLNRNLSYMHFIFSMCLGITVLFIIFLP